MKMNRQTLEVIAVAIFVFVLSFALLELYSYDDTESTSTTSTQSNENSNDSYYVRQNITIKEVNTQNTNNMYMHFRFSDNLKCITCFIIY